jgi:hypothetical protein
MDRSQTKLDEGEKRIDREEAEVKLIVFFLLPRNPLFLKTPERNRVNRCDVS